jgi:hypothetical protein
MRLQHIRKGADELESRFVAEEFESLGMPVCKDMCGARQGKGKGKREWKREKEKKAQQKDAAVRGVSSILPTHPESLDMICSTVNRSSCMRGFLARQQCIYATKERHYKDK